MHLVINNLGEIVSFDLTPANKADNDGDVLEKLLSRLKGMVVGDKGYLTRLWEYFYEKRVKIIHKVRKNMKKKLLGLQEKYYLSKEGL